MEIMKRQKNMRVAEEFDKAIKEVQRDIMKREGKFVSSREITSKIKKNQIEDIIRMSRDLEIKLDRRGI